MVSQNIIGSSTLYKGEHKFNFSIIWMSHYLNLFILSTKQMT